MIGLYLIAAHLVGDFVLQTRWQAARKLASRGYRVQHVVGYLVPFVGVVAYTQPGMWRAAAFLALLAVLHYATDSRRFHSTLGDVIGWYLGEGESAQVTCADPGAYVVGDRVLVEGEEYEVLKVEGAGVMLYAPLPPNPWPPVSIVLDQALHIVQLAVLAGVFLR